jgi:methionyl-tRNA formyltransferase
VSDLHDALAPLGAQAMVDVLAEPLHFGTAQPVDGVTYAKKIDKAEARIDFARTAEEVRNHVHGLSPFPGAWFEFGGTRVKVLRCEVVDASGAAGAALDDQLLIACGSGAVRFLELQREGKGAMKALDFLRGFAIPRGSVLG